MRRLFLDLEDTVIKPVTSGWFKTEMINVQKVKGIIERFRPDTINLFSFALWNKSELKGFNEGTRPMLEDALGIKLNRTWTMDDDIIPMACAERGLHHQLTTFDEVNQFWGKHETFRLCMRHWYSSNTSPIEILLLDDVVYNETFSWPDLKVTGFIINIDTPPKDFL